MRVRLVSIAVPAVLVAAYAGAQERPAPPAAQPDARPGAAADPNRPAAAATLDGTWSVVSIARGGRPLDGADKMTVAVKGNVLTFNAAAGAAATGGPAPAGKDQLRAMRLDFGPNGTVRVTEANADGKFDAGLVRPGGVAGAGGANATAGTAPGVAGAAGAGAGNTQPGTTTAGTGDHHGAMMGVYVLTPDYLALSVYDTGIDSGTGRPATGGAAPAPGLTRRPPPPARTRRRPAPRPRPPQHPLCR
ncbi:unnamed protein product [Gemmataceae bacterium]|nr:unnamed protein product [Gemmataceae bacterium]VTT97831.1 unnamed protein product [Gemmataceae bacterium]